MKFLVHSNGPEARTGYGVQCGHLMERLKDAGHDVALSSTYGTQGFVGSWKGIREYPQGYLTNSPDILPAHAEHWFDGDPHGGWIIPLLDVWCLTTTLPVHPLAKFNVAAWTPVDHFPVPPDVLRFFHQTGAHPIAMSRFGERLLTEAGLDPTYIPLAVDTKVYKPTFELKTGDTTVDARSYFNLPRDAFVVGMVAMNKGWARDRKGFNEAFRAFGMFWKRHQEAVLLVHAEKLGAMEGVNLVELAIHCGIPDHALIWTDQYAYRLGQPSEAMAAMYTAMDVLLAPSHGEGFCVPLIEAQACGTPVIATEFSAQPELVGPNSGWLVTGQPEWDPAQHASYVCPSITDVIDKLEMAYAADLPAIQSEAIAFALKYDVDVVFETFWRPFLATLEPAEPAPAKPPMEQVDILVPAMRLGNEQRFFDSLRKAGGHDGAVRVGEHLAPGAPPERSYAENVNRLVRDTTGDWVLVVGDDVEFRPGWLEAARALSDRFDVIGTNDSEPGRVRNPAVANGSHADHFFVRRSYIEDEGGSLDGPGTLAPECYRHWWVDKEIIGLAKARGVFTPCLDSVIVHHHPGYDGNEKARNQDATYSVAVDAAEADRKTFMSRVGLIEGHRVSRAKVR